MIKFFCRNSVFFCAFCITMFMLLCAGAVIAACGYIYSVVEYNAFGREVAAFSMEAKDYIGFFGEEFYFPLVSVYEHVSGFFKLYCSGIIKLLGYAVALAEELIMRLIGYL